jgi:hypothetical protein
MSKNRILIGPGPDFKMTQGRLDLFHALNFKVYANHKMIRSEYVYNKSLRQMLATIKEKLQPEKQ